MLNLHIVWIPKYRKPILDGYQDELKTILQKIADAHEWTILAMEVMPDHIHLFVSVPPAVAPVMLSKPLKVHPGDAF